jgi:hypothetical protein
MNKSPVKQQSLSTNNNSTQRKRKTLVRRRLLKRLGIILSVFLLCLIAILLVSFFYISQGNPSPLDENFTPDSDQAKEFEEAYDVAVASGKSFTITVTDEQLASWLDLRYERATSEEIENIELLDDLPVKFTKLKNIQVAFEDDQQLAMYAQVSVPIGEPLGLLLRAKLEIDDNGQLEVKVNRAQVGGISVDDNVRKQLAEPIKDALTQRLTPDDREYQLNNIVIRESKLTIKGHFTNRTES